MCSVPIALWRKLIQDALDLCHFVAGQCDIGRVLTHSVLRRSARNRYYDWQAILATQRSDPPQTDLRWRNALFLGQAFNLLDKLKVVVEGFTMEARKLSAKIVGRQVVGRLDLSGLVLLEWACNVRDTCQKATADG
jgi:hypothetical protein